MHHSRVAGFLLGITLPFTTVAADLDQIDTLTRAQFKALGEDLTSALGYKLAGPAAPLGITGFDVGVGLSLARVGHDEVWEQASGDDMDLLPVPALYVTKGLPYGIDIGGFMSQVPSSNIRLWGAHLQYAILEGTVATPALALRATFTSLDGVDQLAFDSKGIELVVSKGFAGLTPYAGAGRVQGKSEARADAAPLGTTKDEATRYFAGLSWNVLLGNLTLEYDRTGDNNALSARMGLRW